MLKPAAEYMWHIMLEPEQFFLPSKRSLEGHCELCHPEIGKMKFAVRLTDCDSS